jgi:hypothetical protein
MNLRPRIILSSLAAVIIACTGLYNVAHAQQKNCEYRGSDYSPGSRLCIGGYINVCYATGTWSWTPQKCN